MLVYLIDVNILAEESRKVPEINSPDQPADQWVMYLIVRESLGMSTGKTGAQCGHVVGMIYDRRDELKDELRAWQREPEPKSEVPKEVLNAINQFNCWKQDHIRKVVLRASDKEWEKVKAEVPHFIVRDAGYTEVPAGSETVIGLWPMKKSQAPKVVRRLQVLK